MTHLVFVHGVATRSEASGYVQAVANRDCLFRKVLFRDPELKIHNPVWGDLVLPIEEQVYNTNRGIGSFSLGTAAQATGGGLLTGGAATGDNYDLASVARAKPAVALDALFAQLIEDYDAKGQPIPPEDLEAFAKAAHAITADEAAGSNQIAVDGTEALIGSPASDAALLQNMAAASTQPAAYGITSAIGDAIAKVTGRVRNIASRLAFDPLADKARPYVGLFLGDVFTYLRDGTRRVSIRDTIRTALLAAHVARAPGEKLVDMLCSPTAAGLPDDFRVDSLFTVGSQPGLFQALGLFLPASEDRIGRPACVARWYNVFDPVDPLAFRADPIFAGVEDLRFDSITGLASAHTTYFKRPQFHARARQRLIEANVITGQS